MKIICTVLFLSMLVSCSFFGKRERSPAAGNENLYVVNIDETPKEEFINLSTFFQDVETVILETNEECLIGEVSTIRVLDDFIVVTDADNTESVFVFDREGRFLHRVGQMGQGPGEYQGVSGSAIDFEKKEIYLLDNSSDKVLQYDIASGKFINSIGISQDGFSSYYIHYDDGKIYTGSIPNSKRDDSFLLQEFDAKTGRPVASYLSALAYNKGWNGYIGRSEGFFYPDEDGGAKYVQMFMDTVVYIQNNEITPYLAIQSKNWITEKEIQELIKSEGENYSSKFHEIMFERDISYNIEQYVEFGNIICFRYYNRKDSEYVVYDKEHKTTRRVDYLKDDLVYSGDWVLFSTFAYADSKGVYSYLRSEQIPRFLEIASTGGLNSNLDKREILEKISEDDNPVVFFYYFKK